MASSNRAYFGDLEPCKCLPAAKMTPLAFRGLLISLSLENKHSETDVSLHVFFIDRPSCIILKVYPPHAFTNWIVSVNNETGNKNYKNAKV